MSNRDLIVQRELENTNSSLGSSIQVEHALAEIKDTYKKPLFAKLPSNRPVVMLYDHQTLCFQELNEAV